MAKMVCFLALLAAMFPLYCFGLPKPNFTDSHFTIQ
jgi:hypothetical protein